MFGILCFKKYLEIHVDWRRDKGMQPLTQCKESVGVISFAFI